MRRSSIQLNVASLEANSAALANLYASGGSDQGTVTVYDSASAITGDLAGLNSDLQVTKIVVSDNGLTAVTISELTSYAHALNELYKSDGTTPAQLTLTDTASNISGAFDTLNGASRVSQIIISDSGSGGVVTIDATQAATDTAALSELYLANGITHAQVAVSDSSGNVQSDLDSLEANHSYISSITLTDGGTPTLTITETQFHNDATVLGDIAGSYQLAVTSVLAADAAIISGGSHVTSVSVTDTAANIASNFDALNGIGGTLVAINVQDAAEVILLAYSAATDTYAEGVLAGGTNAGRVAVSDTAANVVAYATELNANSYVNEVHVVDSATNVTSNLGDLNSVANLSITLDDVGTPVMAVTAAELATDTAALDAISNASFDVAVTYVLAANAGNIAGEVSALTSHATLTSITVGEISNGVFDVAVTNVLASDASDVAGRVLAATGNAVLTSISVTDTGADVGANLDSLNGLANLTAINLTGGTLSVTEYSLTHAATALGLVNTDNGAYDVAVTNVLAADASGIAAEVGAYSNATLTSIAVTDGGVNVGANLDSLNGLAHLTAINLTGGALTITESALANDGTALALINTDNGSYNVAVTNVLAADATGIAAEVGVYSHATLTSISVTDTGTNVGASLNSLNGLAHLTAINLTGGALTITESALANDGTALALINTDNGSYNVAVTNVLAADASGIAAEVGAYSNATLTSIAVTDTAADVQASIASLETLATGSTLTSITLTDGGTPTITLAETAYNADGAALADIVSAYQLTITGALAADAAGIAVNSHVTSILVADSAADVQANIASLEQLATAGTLTSITLTDGSTPTITLSETGYGADSAALGKIVSNYDLAITNVLAADAAAIAENSHVTSIAVCDTGAHISAALDALNGNSDVTTIVVSDNAALNLAAHSAATDSHALGLLTSLVISNNAQLGLNVSQVVNDTRALGELSNQNGSPVTEKVSDSAVNIQTYLNNLQADSLITSIVVSNNVALTLTAAEGVNDTAALAEVSNKNGGAVSFRISDTAANISTYLNQLAASSEFSKISSITVSDNNAVTVSVSQITSDAAMLAKLVDQNGNAYTLRVEDLAANLSGAAFDSLNGNSHVTSIVISDNNAVVLSVSQLENDTRALGELSNLNGSPYALTITDTAADIAADLSGLNGSSHVQKIIVSNSGTGGTITLSAQQAASYGTALGELYQSNGTSHFLVNVSDSSANISTYLNSLESVAADLSTITITDNNYVNVTVAEVVSDETVLAKMHYVGGYVYELSLSDTAANISANINALGANGRIEQITVTDNGVVTATYAQYSQYNSLFYSIQGTHYLDITNVTGQTYSSFTETINGSHQAVLQDFYDSHGNCNCSPPCQNHVAVRAFGL
jgi:hypothetical protein